METSRAAAVELLVQRLRAWAPMLRLLMCFRVDRASWRLEARVEYTKRSNLPDRHPLHEIEEAMGLLTLLHELDVDAYVAMVVEIWSHVVPGGLCESDKEPIGVEVTVSADYGVSKFLSCQQRRQQQGQSAEYQQILQLVRDSGAVDEQWSPQVPVCLIFTNTNIEDSLKLVEKIITLFQENQEDPTSIFKITETRSWFSTLKLGANELQCLSAFEKLGVRYHVYAFGSCAAPCEPAYKLPVLEALRQQLVVMPTELSTRDIVRGAYSLMISPNAYQGTPYWNAQPPTASYWIPALFSAAQSSESLRNIHVDAPFADLREDRRLEWLAYAAFCRPKPLLKLKINCRGMEMRDVDVVRGVFTAEDPHRLLFNCDATKDSPFPRKIEVRATRFHLCDPLATSDIDRVQVYQPSEANVVTVIDGTNANKEWIRVMLPGSGESWVHRDDVTDSRWRESPLAKGSSTIERHGVSVVTLENVTVSSSHATLTLLKTISRGLTRLEVALTRTDFGDAEMDHWFRQVAIICPDLKELQVNGAPVKNLEVFSEAFGAATLRLRQLDIVNPVVCDGGHVRRFFEALADPRHPFASHLQTLHIKVTARFPEEFDLNDAILAVLRHNHKLEEFQIRFCLPRTLEISKNFFHPIRDNNRDDTMLTSLAASSKLAFLSAVTNDSYTSQAASRLNASVIAAIFDFSGRLSKRKVKVEIVRGRF